MRLSLAPVLTLLTLALSPFTAAERLIETNSLNTCMKNSKFSASLFQVRVTPSNMSASLQINGVSDIQGYVVARVELIAYGFTAYNKTVDPCESNLQGFCPMSKAQIPLDTNFDIPPDALAQVPSIGFSVPDLDGVVRLVVFAANDTTRTPLACLEADLSNTKSVYQKAVGWVTAIIAGLGLVTSGITSGMGNTNTAAHVAANAVSLFGVFQAQAVIGMTSVAMPPIVQAWTQNFQWSMGIIRVGFLQSIALWYQRATGGTPTTYLGTLSSISVEVQKRAVRRSLDAMVEAVTIAPRALWKRADATTTPQSVIVRGIDRVGFRAGIEQTNIFMTGLIFFLAILVIVSLLVALTKAIIEGAVRAGWMKSDRFQEFRHGWRIVIKGILFRLVLLGYVQMSILCLWEIVERDSAAEVVLGLFTFISITVCLAWASYKVIMLAKRSLMMHKNAAYILYSDPTCLNKWGFLYVSYKATSYYFVIVLLGYILIKAVFIAFAQSSPVAQAIGLVVVECAFLIIVSVLRPWMDKKTNAFNISIAAVNFVNALFLLIFSNAFGQPPMVSGIMGVIFAFYNIVFMTVLLIMVLISSIYAVTSKNPETRYQPMRDDRGSFIKSQSALTAELDALGQTARGSEKHEVYGMSKDIDSRSVSNESLDRMPTEARPASQLHRHQNPVYANENVSSRGTTPSNLSQVDTITPANNFSRPGATLSPFHSPSLGVYRPQGQPPRSAHNGYGPQQFRSQNSASPSSWQRGAGYD